MDTGIPHEGDGVTDKLKRVPHEGDGVTIKLKRIPHEGDGVTNKLTRVTNKGFWGRQRGFLANPEFRGNILGWL